jgi:uncharacterized protein (TIGR03067 family)
MEVAMRKLRLLMLVVAAGLLAAADANEDAVKKERAKCKGAWKVTSIEIDGQKPYTDDQLEGVTTTIDAAGKLTVEAGSSVVVEATTKIDPTKKPKTIDFSYTEGQLKGKDALGIYELTDDSFKYCRAAPDKPRPTEFSSKEGSGHTLVVLKRAKSNGGN